jgi:hypothetical protein
MSHHCVTIEVHGVTMEVEYDYSPFLPGRWTLSNCDPGYPDEPAELEITSVLIEGYDWSDLLNPKAFELIEIELSKPED